MPPLAEDITSPPRPPAQASWGLAQVPSTKSFLLRRNWLEPPAFGVHFRPPRPASPDFTSLVGLCLLHPLTFCCFFAFFGIHLFTPPPPPPPPLPPPLPASSSPAPASLLGPGNRQVTFEEAVGALWASAADMHQRYRRVSRALCPSVAEAGGVALKLHMLRSEQRRNGA